MKINRKYLKPVLIGLSLFILFRILSSCFQSKDPMQILRSVKVKKGDLRIVVQTTAEVKPFNRVEIKPPIAGRVDEVLVNEGESIKQGQVLAWMSSTERAALLDAARSQGAETLQRWQEAYKSAPLIAPLDGTVIVRMVQPGQTVTTVDPVVVLSDKLIVKARVDETDLAKIKLGQKTQIHLDAYPHQIISGKVAHIRYESELINNVNMYAVDVMPDEVPPIFRSGMTASVDFIVTDRHDVLLVPSEAVADWPKTMTAPQQTDFAVYKKSFSGKLMPVGVQIGDSDGQMTEIVSGLKEGMEVQVIRKKENISRSAFSPMGGRGAGGGRRQGG